MPTLSAEFEFNIGDEVMHASAPLEGQSLLGIKPHKLVVVERVIQQCHGGIQQFYKVRGVVADGSVSNLFDVCAFEVRAYPTQSELDAITEAEEFARDARHEASRKRREARRAEQSADQACAAVEEVKRTRR